MADTATEEKVDGAEETEEKSGGNDKKMLIIGLCAGIAIVAAYFMLFAKPAPAEGEGEEGDPAAEAAESAEVTPIAVQTLPPEEGEIFEVATLTVNLDGDQMRYARVQFGIVTNGLALEPIDPLPRIPLLQDKAITTIAGFSASELRTVDGHQRLRDELTADAVEVWPAGEVIKVILYDLIVQ